MTAGQRILIVSVNRRNLELLAQVLEGEGYSTCAVSETRALDEVLREPAGIALALLDLAGFDASIWERCERLRQGNVPYLIISPSRSAALEREGLSRGARGILVKPLAIRELIGLIHDLLGH